MNGVARKTTTLTVVLALMLALLFGLLAAFGGTPAAAQSDPGGAPSGDGVDPVFWPGNPDCSTLGNYRERKVEPVNAGSYPSSDGYLTATISNIRDGRLFDWSSTRGIDRVIVKGGSNADAYVYNPEDTADTNLHAPVNPNNGQYFGLSHVSFCYDVEPQVSKTAVTSFTRTYDWEITKTVTPETWDLFKGDSGESEYTVSVNRTGFTDSNWAVSGKITVTNPLANEPLTITQIVDIVKQGSSNTTANVSNCTFNNNPVTLPFVLAPNASLECSYSASLNSGTNGTNEARAGAIGTGITDGVGTASVTFGNPTNEVNKTVTVKDDFEGTTTTLGTATTSKTFDPYTRTFNCDADEGEHTNTATVYGDNNAVLDDDSATVTVDCHALNVSKNASTSFKRTYNWTIDKTVTPDTWDLFKGDSGKSGYTVSVDKTGSTDGDWKVEGTITVTNSTPINAKLISVTDVVSPNIAVAPGNIDCEDASGPVAFPYVLAKDGGTLSCTYEAILPDDSDRTNTATATMRNFDYDSEGGKTAAGTTDFSGTAQVSFANAQIDEVNKSITVDDTYAGAGSPWTFNDDGSATYDRTFACSADEGTHNNTATIRETGQSDGARVTVNCHALNVTKDANTSFERKWDWTVVKKIDDNGQLKDQLDLTLSSGQAYNASYKVTYNAASTDSNWKVAGAITVTNPAPIPAEVTNVTDLVSPNISANITECNGDATPEFPYTLAANGGSLTCSYSAELPDAASRTNTATAVLQNYNYNHDLQGGNQKAGTTSFNSSAVPVNFSQATITEIDEEITVSDTYQGSSVTGTVGAGEVPKVFTYVRQIGPYSQCGNQPPVENTASFVTNDTGATGEDTATVNVNVPCNGCTLTIGFWKTHADPTSPRANPDYTLQILAAQPNGTIWLGTPPVPPATNKSVAVTSANVVNILKFDGANGIRKLQAQLLAAKLNIANGADPSAVQSTINAADLFLTQYAASNWDDLSKVKKQQVLSWMNTLDRYNNGLIGPGHCSESPIS